MRNFYNASFLLLLSLLPGNLFSQITIDGIIRNTQTGAPLPAANIQIENTYDGTITNNDGEYTLQVDQLPVTLLISYIGYATERTTITTTGFHEILMTPVVYELDAILVTDEDPAVNIMRKVIENKQQWRAALQTYRAEAYTRVMLENDSGIVSITETSSEAFWDHEEGPREVIKNRRQTKNVREENNFAGASYIANFYDDDIEMLGFQMVGPTHPDAIKHYHFKLEGRRYRDDKVVYDISLRPKSKLQSAFIGRISVLDEAYAMIEVDLKPTENLLYPAPIQGWDVHYRQQFSNYGKAFWLPVDVRIEGMAKFGFPGLSFPPIGYRQISSLTAYEVNIALPDSLYNSDKIFHIDSTTVAEQESETALAVIPFSPEEDSAYSSIDSTETFAKVFKPSGMLARFVDMDDDDEPGGGNSNKPEGFFGRYVSISPQLWYNRVDGGHFGATVKLSPRPLQISGGLAYERGLERWSYTGGLHINLNRSGSYTWEANFNRGVQKRYHSDSYSAFTNSISILAGYDDYFDYYWEKSFETRFSFPFRPLRLRLTAGFYSGDHRSLSKQTDYSLLKNNFIQRENPPVAEGVLRSSRITIAYGEDFVPFGVIGQTGARLTIEHSNPDVFNSDFSFTKYHFSADLRVNTFFRRRILPNALDIRLVAGTASGDLPPQRFGILESGVRSLKPFGTFKTLIRTPYEGEKYAGIFWEHNFRTVPFEIIGLRSFAKRGIGIIIHGASGRTWLEGETRQSLNYTPRFTTDAHHEAGISFNNLFGLLRLDLAQRLDKSNFYIGFSMARLF